MTALTPEATVAATYDPIHDIGTTIYLSPEVMTRAAEWGWDNPFAFYFAGRGGMLGDVDARVVTAAMGWFEPSAVALFYEEGRAVAGSRAAADRMAEATAAWGRARLAAIGPEVLEPFVAAATTLVDGVEASGLPLFAGWRDHPRPDDPDGLAAVLCQLLREWRGGVHLCATTAVGLTPLEAILGNEGRGQAKFLGWREPFPDPEGLADLHAEAEALTDRRCAAELGRALPEGDRAAFVAGVDAVKAALPTS